MPAHVLSAAALALCVAAIVLILSVTGALVAPAADLLGVGA